MKLSRRDFLLSLSTLAAVQLVPFGAVAATHGNTRWYLVGSQKNLACYNLNTKTIHTIPLAFSPHSYIRHPTRPATVWSIEKNGFHAAEIDVANGKVQRAIQCPADHIFYGHGVFVKSTETLLITAANYKTGKACLLGYNIHTGAIATTVPIDTTALHDCLLLPDESIMIAYTTIDTSYATLDDIEAQAQAAAGNTAARPLNKKLPLVSSGIMHVNITDGSIIKRYAIDDDNQAINHFRILDNGGVIALSMPWDNLPYGHAYYASSLDDSMQRIAWSDDVENGLFGDFLSVAFNPKERHVAVTNPGGKSVIFVDSDTGTYQGIERRHVNDIAYDDQRGIFISSSESALWLHTMPGNWQQLATHMAKKEPMPTFTGSHSFIL